MNAGDIATSGTLSAKAQASGQSLFLRQLVVADSTCGQRNPRIDLRDIVEAPAPSRRSLLRLPGDAGARVEPPTDGDTSAVAVMPSLPWPKMNAVSPPCCRTSSAGCPAS